MVDNQEGTIAMTMAPKAKGAGKEVPVKAKLICVDGPLKGREVKLEEPEYTVGRDPNSNSIGLTDPSISRRHAKIYLESGQWAIEDQNSTNGVWQKESRIQKGYLRDGEQIKIGNIPFRFELEPPPKPLDKEITLLPQDASDSMVRIKSLPYTFHDEKEKEYFKIFMEQPGRYKIQLIDPEKSLTIVRRISKQKKGDFDVQEDQSELISDTDKAYPLQSEVTLNLTLSKPDSKTSHYRVIIPEELSEKAEEDSGAEKTMFFGEGANEDKTQFGGSQAINKFMEAATVDNLGEEEVESRSKKKSKKKSKARPAPKAHIPKPVSRGKIKFMLFFTLVVLAGLIGAGGYFGFLQYQQAKLEASAVADAKRKVYHFITTYEKRVTESPEELAQSEQLRKQIRILADTFPINSAIQDSLAKARFLGFERKLNHLILERKREQAQQLIKMASMDFKSGQVEYGLLPLARYIVEFQIFNQEFPEFPFNSKEVPDFEKVKKMAGLAKDLKDSYLNNNQPLTVWFNYFGRMAKDTVDNCRTRVLRWQMFWKEYQEYALEKSKAKQKGKLKKLKKAYPKITLPL